METAILENPAAYGTPLEQGFYAGRARINSAPFALLIPPKVESDHGGAIWIHRRKDVPGAKSYSDGLSNTQAMGRAGSKIAEMALDLGMYIPSLDELEIAYRNLKPGRTKNSCWSRSGINLSAIDPTAPYTPEFPVQTQSELFQEGGAEAFELDLYMTSTQHASVSAYAWFQSFNLGGQYYGYKSDKLRVRFFRRSKIQKV